MSASKTKTKRIKDQYSTGRTVLRLVKDLKPIAWALLLTAIVCGGNVALSVIAPNYVGEISDILYAYSKGTPIVEKQVIELCIKLLIAYAGTAVLSMLTVVLMTNVTSRYYTYGMRVRISDKLQRLPIAFVDGTPKGEVISRMMNDVSNMSTTIHVIIELFISGIIKLVVIVVMLVMINVWLALAVTVLIPFSILLSAYIASKSEKYWKKYRAVNGKLYSFVEEDYTGFDTVKAFNLEQRQSKINEQILQEYGKQIQKSWWMSGIVQPIVALTNNIAYVAVCLIGGYFAISNIVSVGEIVEVILLAKMMAAPLESIANGMGSINRTVACANRVYKVLDSAEMPLATSEEQPLGKGDVEFVNVNFAYDKDKPLIKNLNLSVKAGQKVAIVGPTGGGKTTIVNLLMRFYDVDSGKILIDNVDITQIDRNKLRRQFAMVLQDTWLFSGSVYDNIAYGKADATKEEVEQAAKKAHIDHFIRSLPQGYDTEISEDAGNISSGQKQLLTIARAYLADRKMLILDEATSNVDTRTELLIQRMMDELMQGRTSFVIAHRLSTIVNADIILVINNGSIVEQGTHEQLLKLDGFYAEIYNSQYELLK